MFNTIQILNYKWTAQSCKEVQQYLVRKVDQMEDSPVKRWRKIKENLKKTLKNDYLNGLSQ